MYQLIHIFFSYVGAYSLIGLVFALVYIISEYNNTKGDNNEVR